MGFLVFLNDSFPQVLLKKISKVSTPNLQIIPPVREPLGRPARNATGRSSTPSPKIATPKVPLHVLPLLPKQPLPSAVTKLKAKNIEPIAAASDDAPSYGAAAALPSSSPDPAPDYLPPNENNMSDSAIDSESATPPPAYLPPKKEDKSAMKTTMETTTAMSKTMDDVVTYPMSTKETTASSTDMTTPKSSTEADTSSSPVTYPQDTLTTTSTTTSTSPMTKAAPATTTSTTTTTEADNEEPVTDSMQAGEPLEQQLQEELPEGYLPPVPSANPMSLPSDTEQKEPNKSENSDNIDSNYLPPNPSPKEENPPQSSTSAPFYLPPKTESVDSAAMSQRGPSAFSAEPPQEASNVYDIYSYSDGPQPVPYFMPPVAREMPQQSNFNSFYSLRNGRSLRPARVQQATGVQSGHFRNGMDGPSSSFGNSLRPEAFSGYQYSIERNDGSAHVYVYHGK